MSGFRFCKIVYKCFFSPFMQFVLPNILSTQFTISQFPICCRGFDSAKQVINAFFSPFILFVLPSIFSTRFTISQFPNSLFDVEVTIVLNIDFLLSMKLIYTTKYYNLDPDLRIWLSSFGLPPKETKGVFDAVFQRSTTAYF